MAFADVRSGSKLCVLLCSSKRGARIRHYVRLAFAIIARHFAPLALYIAFILQAGCLSVGYKSGSRNTFSYADLQSLSRDDLRERFGEPVQSSASQDIFKIRGREEGDQRNNFVDVLPYAMYGGPASVLAIAVDLVVFPYIVLEESYGALFNSFCLKVDYGSDNRIARDSEGRLSFDSGVRCPPPYFDLEPGPPVGNSNSE